ncbi:MAG: hypothetical protein R3Y33_05025 [Clostridia bacterium]
MANEQNLLFWSNPLIDSFKNNVSDAFSGFKNLTSSPKSGSLANKNILNNFEENNFFENENNSFNSQNSMFNLMSQQKNLEKLSEKENFSESVFNNTIKENDKNYLSEKDFFASEKFASENNNYFDKQSEFNSIESEKASEIRNDVLREQMASNLTDIKLDMSGMSNNINNEMDIDTVVKKLTEKIETALMTSAEGVHLSV